MFFFLYYVRYMKSRNSFHGYQLTHSEEWLVTVFFSMVFYGWMIESLLLHVHYEMCNHQNGESNRVCCYINSSFQWRQANINSIWRKKKYLDRHRTDGEKQKKLWFWQASNTTNWYTSQASTWIAIIRYNSSNVTQFSMLYRIFLFIDRWCLLRAH